VPDPLPPILPVGTAVVALTEVRGPDGRVLHPRGSAGLITKSPADPEHSYRVRFPGGDEVSLRRRDLQTLKHFQREGYQPDPLTQHDLYQHVIYRCIVGSRAYGLSHDESDTDRRGVYLPPAHMHWSIYGVPEQLENPETEETYWELEKFLKLALKANPNVLEALYTPLVEHVTPLAEELRAMRSVFLSKLIYQTFNGYAISQFKKLEADLRNKGAIKWKHAMHLIRLLLAGIETLRTHELPVQVLGAHKPKLVSIRDGELPWEQVDAWRLELHAAFEHAFTATTLPDRPDYEAANSMLIRARRTMAEAGPCGESPL
jgi:hypothetical protein